MRLPRHTRTLDRRPQHTSPHAIVRESSVILAWECPLALHVLTPSPSRVSLVRYLPCAPPSPPAAACDPSCTPSIARGVSCDPSPTCMQRARRCDSAFAEHACAHSHRSARLRNGAVVRVDPQDHRQPETACSNPREGWVDTRRTREKADIKDAGRRAA